MFRKLVHFAIPVVLLGATALGTPLSQAAPTNHFATVDLSGTLLHGGGVASVSHLGTGQYEVAFNSPIGACAYVATTTNAHSQALGIFTAGGHLSGNGVYVETKNQGGGLTDGPFHLVVDCGTPGTKYAVVGYSADLVRATPGTSLASLGFGRYTLTFQGSVKNCAFLASVGDPGRDLVFNPSGVYTASGSNGNSVYIETKNSGGGLQSGVPFHLAVLCPTAPDVRTAVVAANGLPDRGSALTSTFAANSGSYAVVTNRDLSACATVATRGSINKDVPFSPATVEIVPGPAANTAGIQVRNLLFFGGNLIDEAVHVATVC
jgi:hypothetical protein